MLKNDFEKKSLKDANETNADSFGCYLKKKSKDANENEDGLYCLQMKLVHNHVRKNFVFKDEHGFLNHFSSIKMKKKIVLMMMVGELTLKKMLSLNGR